MEALLPPTAATPQADTTPETDIRLGIDEFTVVLQPSEKAHPDDWRFLAEDMTEEFLLRSQIESVLGTLAESQRKLVQGYTDGYTLEESPFYFCICYNAEQENMGVCVKFSATSWAAYRKNYTEKFHEDMDVIFFLRKTKSELYTLRLSRIDFTADYFNYPCPFQPGAYLEPDTIYRQLRDGRIKVCDHEGKCNIKSTSAHDKDFTHETLYIGSRKGNTQSFLRIYDKKQEQLDTHGFRHQEAASCSSWVRFEAVYKGKYAHQISDFFLDENNVFKPDPDTLVCFIAAKITDKYRFMLTSTGELLSFSEDLVNTASGIAAAPLSCPSPRDNSLFQSLNYIIHSSGFMITLAKACYCYPERNDVMETLFDWLGQAFEKFYLPMVNSREHRNHELWKWLKKHKTETQKQALEQILREVKNVPVPGKETGKTEGVHDLIEKDN